VAAAQRAIAQKDSVGLAALLSQGEAERWRFPRETLWRDAAAAGQIWALEELWRFHARQFEIEKYQQAALTAAIGAGHDAAVDWLLREPRPSVSFDVKASLAAYALKTGDVPRAFDLIAPLRALPDDHPRKARRLAEFLHAAAANGRTAAAMEILQAHYLPPMGAFALTPAFCHQLVMRAATADQAATTAQLLAVMQDRLSPDNLAQALVAAIDRGRPAVAELLISRGADPLLCEGAALRHALRGLSAAVAAEMPPRGPMAEDAVETRLVLLKRLVDAGADPAAGAEILGEMEISSAARQEMTAMLQDADAAAKARHLPRILAAIEKGDIDLHDAARHRVLARLMAEGAVALPGSDDWRRTDAAGRSLAALSIASGEIAALFMPAAWRGQLAGVEAFLAALPDGAPDAGARGALVQQVQLAALAEALRRGGRGGLKL
jgi:hypothetical protein